MTHTSSSSFRSQTLPRAGALSRAGTGFSDHTDSFSAGAEAASEALRSSGIEGEVHLAFLMTTSRHNPQAFAAGVRSVLGAPRLLLGGCGVGFITNRRLGYDGYQSAVAILQSETVLVDAFIETTLATEGERATGYALGKQIAAHTAEGSENLLLFYDAVNRTSGKLKMTMGTTLLEGLQEALPQMPPAAGGGLTGDMQFGKSFQWWGEEILSTTAMALRFSGTAQLYSTIMHGCMPASAYHTVTKADGSVILEIDGEPALDFVERLIGGGNAGLSFEDYGFFLSIGVNRGDAFAPFNTDNYMNCMCVNVDKKRRGIVMVENNLQAGTQIQLMRRSLHFEYMGKATTDLLQSIQKDGKKPLLAFYIDCAGRAAYYLGSDKEEAREVQRALGKEVPLMGFYSGVEIARVGGVLQPLDWTGVLAIIAE